MNIVKRFLDWLYDQPKRVNAIDDFMSSIAPRIPPMPPCKPPRKPPIEIDVTVNVSTINHDGESYTLDELEKSIKAIIEPIPSMSRSKISEIANSAIDETNKRCIGQRWSTPKKRTNDDDGMIKPTKPWPRDDDRSFGIGNEQHDGNS